MDIVLGCVFLLCLALLIMIFGEQLSILGAFHGRWISALAESFADLCDFMWDEIDRAFDFVVEHVWWVLAVSSGGSGGLIVAWMMFGGVADQATAELAGRAGRLDAGGILDEIPEIDSQTELEKTSFDRRQEPIARRTYQVPSPWSRVPDRGLGQDEDRGLNSFDDGVLPPWPGSGRDFDEPEFRDLTRPAAGSRELATLLPEDRLRTQRVFQPYSDWQLEVGEERLLMDEDSVTEVRGTTIVSGSLRREIDYALNQLEFERTRWRAYDGFAERRRETDGFGPVTRAVREVTEDELGEFEAGIRVVSGTSIAESDLSIEKRLLPTSEASQFNIEIQVTNRSRRRMSGLLVRERLSYGVQPVSIEDDGVYRDDTVTWVISELRPQATETLTATVSSDSGRSLVTRTEISAVAAVASEVYVEPRRREERPTRQPTRRPVVRRPDVRLSIGDIPEQADVRENLEIPFQLSNLGSGVAGEIRLRIILPLGLDHYRLDETDETRSVVVSMRDLEPGQSRTVMLRVRAVESGLQSASMQLLVDRREVDERTFEIRVREPNRSDLPPLEPEPDYTVPPRRP